MKTKFSKQFILENCGCYSQEQVLELYSKRKKKGIVTAEEIIKSPIPLKDKYWFFCKKVFTKEQNQQIAISVAEIVLPIYEAKYPNSLAPRQAIEAAKLYLIGHISLEKLLETRRAADAVTYAVAAAYAADAVAAAYAADAADAAAYAADAAAYAADAADAVADAAAYRKKLLGNLSSFMKNNSK